MSMLIADLLLFNPTSAAVKLPARTTDSNTRRSLRSKSFGSGSCRVLAINEEYTIPMAVRVSFNGEHQPWGRMEWTFHNASFCESALTTVGAGFARYPRQKN